MKRFNKIATVPYILVLIILVILPTLFIAGKALIEGDSFSIGNFKTFFGNSNYIRIMVSSLKYALITTLICIVIGYPVAYGLWKIDKTLRYIITLFIMMPMWLNLVARVRAIDALLTSFKVDGNDLSIYIGMVLVFIPFMIMAIATQLDKIDVRLLEASNDLGASKVKTFLRVTLPLSIPGVLSGVVLVLLPSATTVVIPKIIGDGKLTIGNIIEEFAFTNTGFASAIAIAVVAIMIIIMLFISTAEKKYEVGGKDA